jgi:hypothetical protein
MPEDGLKALTSVYRWFNEGSTTGDLIEAKEPMGTSWSGL